jgi:RNA polymerase sigma factor (sigma-70 family)
MTNGSPEDRLPHLAARIGADYADSFAACRALMATMFDLETPSPEQRAGYMMDFALYDYGPIKLGQSVAITAPSIMTRSPQLIARTGVDHFHIQYYRTNGFAMIVDGAERQIGAGDICMLDLARPATLRTEGIDNLSAIVERGLLAPLLADVGDVHGLVLSRDSEAGIAVREHLDDLWLQGPDLTIAQGLELSHATAALLAAVIRTSSQSRAANRAALRKSQFRAICRRIDRQIADPDLGPIGLTRDFYVTRPTLYRMFEPHGGIGRYILGRRLTGVFRDLSDPSLADRKIAAILSRWGFANHTAAGRAFRRAYGMTPSECRVARTRHPSERGHRGRAGIRHTVRGACQHHGVPGADRGGSARASGFAAESGLMRHFAGLTVPPHFNESRQRNARNRTGTKLHRIVHKWSVPGYLLLATVFPITNVQRWWGAKRLLLSPVRRPPRRRLEDPATSVPTSATMQGRSSLSACGSSSPAIIEGSSPPQVQSKCHRPGIWGLAMPLSVTALKAQHADLLRYIGRRVGDSTISEDIVQEAYLRLLAYEAKRDNAINNVTAFLRRVSLNLARDHFRQAGRQASAELSEDIPCPQPTVDLQLERRQLIGLVVEILKAMPPLRRDVFIRRRVHGQSAGEVAEALELSPSAVSNHVARALYDLDMALEKIERRGGSVRD